MTYYKTCVTSKDSDQPSHPCSLIRVIADRMCHLQPPGCPKRDEREPVPYSVDVQAHPSFCWYLVSCRFCRALAHLSFANCHLQQRYIEGGWIYLVDYLPFLKGWQLLSFLYCFLFTPNSFLKLGSQYRQRSLYRHSIQRQNSL